MCIDIIIKYIHNINNMAGYQKFFKYINFFIIYVISFVLMFKQNLEMLGVGMSFIINMIAQLFLLMDINSSPKSRDIIALILSFAILMVFISNVMVSIKLTELHSAYSRKELPVRLDKDDQTSFNIYKIVYITIVMLIGISAFLYFGVLEVKEGVYEPYFNFDFSKYVDSNNNINFMGVGLQLFMLILKGSMMLAILGIGGYMLYAGLQFSKINTNALYIPEEPEQTHDTSIFRHNSTTFSSAYDIFRNLNINYLIQSRHTISL